MENPLLKLFSFLMFVNILFLQSCQKEGKPQNCDGENTQILETFYSGEFDEGYCRLQNINTSDKEVHFVIDNQADFEKYISCSEQTPAIDFEKYFILAGVYRHNQCAVFDSQQVYLCNNKIIYSVGMIQQDCYAFTSVFYMTAIEKKHSNITVEFNVKFKN